MEGYLAWGRVLVGCKAYFLTLSPVELRNVYNGEDSYVLSVIPLEHTLDIPVKDQVKGAKKAAYWALGQKECPLHPDADDDELSLT